MMQCYEHAKAGEMRDAVAVCSNCGAAVCMDHLIEAAEVIPVTNEERRHIFCQVCGATEGHARGIPGEKR